ncbi:phosphatase domain-containing protein [Wenxinia marina]|uniref:phosphatase domain-containing protein n=1 Tax=Wenxinia marina TaxID=390641 RepID=UPI0003AA8A26|nr:phosphatase domain-containing protein [Wenxinia marina]
MDRGIARWHRRHGRDPVIDPHVGYATPAALHLRGRILSRVPRIDPGVRTTLGNLRQMASLFVTDEVSGVEVTAPAYGISTRSDAEGYFALEVPRPASSGWHEVEVRAGVSAVTMPALVPRGDATLCIVSDIDDTVIRTGAWSLWRNLATTFTGGLASREVFADGVELLTRLEDGGRNPVFFVSSSPWNLHDFLSRLLGAAGVPRGPMFLRDFGLAHRAAGHEGHKGRAIDTILAAVPDLPFVLIGDTGQRDAHVYRAAAERHPGRVRAVILRRAGREAEAAEVAALRAMGVPVEVVADYGAVSFPG